MKKVLYISPNKLFDKNGGALGQRKIYFPLQKLVEEKMITLDVITLDNNLKETLFKVKKNKLLDVYTRILGHSNYLNIYARKILKYVKRKQYDYIILGNSRLGYIAHKIRSKTKAQIITHFDNVELDYCDSVYQNAKGLKKVQKKWEQKNTKKDEYRSLLNSDKLLCLSLRDQKRLEEIYKLNIINRCVIYPVCISKTYGLEKSSEQHLVFVGTLNYKSNIVALENLIKVFKQQSYFSRLVVGGSHVSQEVRDLILKNDNIVLKENFETYKDIACKGDILVSYITRGAGMKVKVAEAMSFGLLVCGSTETFIGYEDVLCETSGLYICNTNEEYLKCFKELSIKAPEEIEELANRNIELYKKHFSMEQSYQIMRKLLCEV